MISTFLNVCLVITMKMSDIEKKFETFEKLISELQSEIRLLKEKLIPADSSKVKGYVENINVGQKTEKKEEKTKKSKNKSKPSKIKPNEIEFKDALEQEEEKFVCAYCGKEFDEFAKYLKHVRTCQKRGEANV